MERKILIISPHYPPSNLAGVHRSRLFAKHLPALGWTPIILTVDEKFYEEKPDWHLHQLLPGKQQIEKVIAFPVTRPRLIGDIGLRAYFQLRRKALSLIRREEVDFVYIPIPSFYISLLGPYLHRKTGVKYGVDYIDPWVHHFPGSDKVFSRHWWSMKLSRVLEPIAVKKASLITGVAEEYYSGVQERNPRLVETCLFGAMPYGGEQDDHERVKELGIKPYLFHKKSGKHQMVYAGALLPKAIEPLKQMFDVISQNRELFDNVEFHFIGTGKTSNDANGYNIKPLAEKFGLWQTVVFEYPARIPYLDVLVHLDVASGIFILGSTEPHYTPSKIYQAILSGKPILAMLHQRSEAYRLLNETGAGITVGISEDCLDLVQAQFPEKFREYICFSHSFLPMARNAEAFRDYSAFAVTQKLVDLLDKISSNQK